MLSNEEKKVIKHKIQSNQHEVFVVSFAEMDAILRSSQKLWDDGMKSAWSKVKGKTEFGASYYASADDLRTISKLVGDLGGFTTKAYVKNYGGKPHIVIKGYPGLRKVFTGTKYGIKNPKVVTMGLGSAGAVHAAKSGGILSVILLTGCRVIDYFLTDSATLTQLVGSLATDIVKVGIATAASIAAASFAGFAITVAVGPIVAVLVAGVVASIALSALDTHYGITDKIIKGLDEVGEDIESYIKRIKLNVQSQINEAVEDVIDYAIASVKDVSINLAKHSIDQFLSRGRLIR
ncbi:MAG: hypothetical protein ACJAW8_000690 [Oleispira sp.]|jgi:hypothetical protein